MTFSYKTDYEENALDRNIEFFKGLLNWEKLLTIYAEDSQEIEDVLNEFHEKLNVQFGEGDTLDVFGKIFLAARGNLDDDEYRSVILTAFAEFQRSGEIETIISVYKSLMLASKITLIEYFPATFIANAEVDDPDAIETLFVRDALSGVKAAGVEMDLTVSQNTGAFSFISEGGSPDPSLGWSSVSDPTSGGVLGKILEKTAPPEITNIFAFISIGDSPDPTLGWSSLADPTSGGIFSSVLD